MLQRSAGPAGLITARVHDLLCFARMHLDGGVTPDGRRVLSAGSAKEMTKWSADVPDPHTLGGDSWGLGWIRFEWNGARLIGHDGATIGPDTTLTDVSIGKGAHVIRTHGSSAVIGDGASVGPFAYLRPGTELGADGKIGTFVETKNASIGTGSKVPHLTYVGDADIGEHSNIGASSVFVNYNGETKSRTTIGSHVRTGSDTMFVAPVTIGDGAYTGAGTVVRDDVPPGALAVSAGPQRTIEGWVERKRPGSAAAQAAAAARAAAEATGE